MSKSPNSCLHENESQQKTIDVVQEDRISTLILASHRSGAGSQDLFNPAIMQEGVTYYIAAVAGENNAGNVDLNNACLDFSNAIELIWRPKISVVFSVDNPNVCSGECTSVTLTFTGEPPFLLTYTKGTGNTSIAEFTDNMGIIEVCAPFNAPAGSLVVQATELEDAHCVCN